MSVPSHFGRYRVLRPLAAGEMGVVYLAEDPLIGRRVAIKGLRFDATTDDSEIQRLQQRFEQEIQIAGTFSHPNIVTLYDVGHQDGHAFIAMEYVEGRNLRAELQAHGRMSVERTMELAVPMSRALSYAHERKVIHRDIKPTNILVSSEGIPKITDFGVARLYGSTLTHTGKIFGTPAYMSPEQAIGGDLTGASDQFAVAAVVYELLTGERPFRGTSPTAVIYEVIEHHPEPPHHLIPLVPTAVSKVVMRGLEKNPEDRYEDCEAFGDALAVAADWSSANPDVAYLGTVEEVVAVISGERPAQTHKEPPAVADRVREGLQRAAETVAAMRLPERARGLAAAAANSPRSMPAMIGGGVGLVILLTVVTMVANAGSRSNLDLIAPVDAGIVSTASPAAERVGGEPAIGTAGPESVDDRRPGDQERPGGASVDGADDGEGAPAEVEAGDDGPPVSMSIVTRPIGARVLVNGEPLAEASPVAIDVFPGRRYTIRLELEGHRPLSWAFGAEDLSEAHRQNGELFFPLAPIAGVGRPVVEEEVPSAATAWNAELPASRGAATADTAAPPTTEATAPPPTPGPIRRVRAPGQAPAPTKTRHVAPELPDGVSAEGVVVLEIEVSARGNVVQAKVLRGMDPTIDQAALAAVVRWKYEPTVLAGDPVHVLFTVTLPIGSSPSTGGR